MPYSTAVINKLYKFGIRICKWVPENEDITDEFLNSSRKSAHMLNTVQMQQVEVVVVMCVRDDQ